MATLGRQGMVLPVLACALVASCARDHVTPQLRTTAEPIEFVVSAVPKATSIQSTLRFGNVTANGVEVTRTVTLPGHVAQLDWAGSDPVVLLGDGWCVRDCKKSPHDGEVGTVSASGYHPVPSPPAAAWTALSNSQPGREAGETKLSVPWWSLVVSSANEVWLGRCTRGWEGDGHQGCSEEWLYSRLTPGPEVTTFVAPEAAPHFALPVLAAPTAVRVDFIEDPQRKKSDAAAAKDATTPPQATHYLRCTEGNDVREFPPEHERIYAHDVKNLAWLSTEPPLFQVDEWSDGIEWTPRATIYEGCKPSKQFDGASIVGGPGDAIAILAKGHLSIRIRGREVGTLENVAAVRFAPLARSGSQP